jgi:hypothetical protein
MSFLKIVLETAQHFKKEYLMKAFIVSLLAVFSFSAMAEISNSELNPRHQKVIRTALVEKCDVPNAWLIQVSNQTTAHRVDNGITDYTFETEIEVEGNGVVTVLSAYYDGFNHAEQNWGTYTVESIQGCN